MLVDGKDAGRAAEGMAALSRDMVKMMTRKSELEESGVWQTLGEKKKKTGAWQARKKKKRERELTHLYSQSHRSVHTNRHGGEKAWSLTSARMRWRIEGRKAQSQIFVKYPDGSEQFRLEVRGLMILKP